ncbi:MAG: rRNA pseudouridine synthase [Candidatus Atribacteria bacterium]|nr:rRNA pseudouridine synthase [Candidatus Atribacteria bacterium]
MKVRLQKYLAEMGIDSRRKCEEYIIQGKVKVNHSIITKLGTKIDPAYDLVEYQHQIIKEKLRKIYVLLNKPDGYLCTSHDPFGRLTIFDLLKGVKTRLSYAGRLDYHSEGLVLLTNDGDLIYQLTHPGKEISKVYQVIVEGFPKMTDLERLEKGVSIYEDFTTGNCKIKVLEKNISDTLLEVTIHEGKKRQIRRMFSYIGLNVIRLRRIRIGNLSLDNLKPGCYRYLRDQEIRQLKKYDKK